MQLTDSELHVVVGIGPVGRAVIDELVSRGLRVRAVARDAAADLVSTVEFMAADVTDADDARRALAGAKVVYHAASAPYHRWPELLPPIMSGVMAGASASGARVVYADNLYAYGPVAGQLTEDLPPRASGPNGRVRAVLADRLLKAHAAGRVQATIGRAADYYGPRGRQSQAGERVFGPAVSGKAAQVQGNPDLPHTFTYLGDFARGLVTLGTRDEALGQVWHVPSAETITQREFVHLVFSEAGRPAKLRVLPSAVLALLGLVNPTLRAVKEQLYQLERPLVVNHSKFAQAFGAQTTPHPDAIRVTLAWFATTIRGASDA
jgi:nucleoside-diphosphate-sugar epimerase